MKSFVRKKGYLQSYPIHTTKDAHRQLPPTPPQRSPRASFVYSKETTCNLVVNLVPVLVFSNAVRPTQLSWAAETALNTSRAVIVHM